MKEESSTARHIKLCSSCDGAGTNTKSEISDYHRGEYKDWQELCTRCNGSGRVKVLIETTTTTEPYDNPEVANILFKKLKEDK